MKKICKTILLTAMMLVTMLSLSACKKSLDVTTDLNVTFSGANGKGTAEIEFPNSHGLYGYIAELTDTEELDYNNLNTWSMLGKLGDAVSYELSEERGLSNGDQVTVTVTVDTDALKKLGYSAKSTSKTFTVEGLRDPVEVDAFKDFEVSFSGISPSASVEYPKSQELDGVTVHYKLDGDQYRFKDGDTVTVTASLSNSEYYYLKEESKTFTVSGVEKYITDNDELLPETLDTIRSKGDAVMAEKIQNWGYFTYHGFEYVGYEFWSRQEDNFMGNVNAVYLYYKINITDENGEAFSSYYYVGFDDVLQHIDGSQEVNLEKYDCPMFGLYIQLKDYTTLESRADENAATYGIGYNIQKNYK